LLRQRPAALYSDKDKQWGLDQGFLVIEIEEVYRDGDRSGHRGLNLVGGDVVEVSPPFDMSGNTALVAVTIMFEILCLLAEHSSQR
jgi:hypothetical protein